MRARMALQLAEIKCEIREIRLSNKPEHMLEISPKGTVPILILEDKIIDESYDNESDNDKRMSMAFEQATKLARINDHDEMYNKVHEILRHNQNLCKDHQSRLTGVRDFVGAHLQYRRLMK